MYEIAFKSEDMLPIDAQAFNFWWEATKDRLSFSKLRGMMAALLVASDTFKDKINRHALMREISEDAYEPILDE
ncbi:hypothetical protein diail_4796, partial [Diaporthe ilicicola]